MARSQRARSASLVALGLVAWSLGASGSDGAEATAPQSPTVWQRVRRPELAQRYQLLRLADRKREPKDETYDSLPISTQLHRAAATLLELAHVETTDDVELLYLYGECLAYAGSRYALRARTVLERALELAPSHPSATTAWDTLGRVRLALGDYAAGQWAFEQALETEPSRPVRDAILIEQGLGALRARELDLAIERLRAAASDSQEPVAWAVSEWSLAVAMDRAMWGPEAERLAFVASQARFGPSGKQDVLALPDAELEPDAEVHYYRALAAMGRARAAGERAQRVAYQEAKFSWLRYIDAVGPTGPWLGRVAAHLTTIERAEARLSPDEGDLHRQALHGANFEGDDGDAERESNDAASDADAGPLWPEEFERGAAFWGLDAGAGE